MEPHSPAAINPLTPVLAGPSPTDKNPPKQLATAVLAVLGQFLHCLVSSAPGALRGAAPESEQSQVMLGRCPVAQLPPGLCQGTGTRPPLRPGHQPSGSPGSLPAQGVPWPPARPPCFPRAGEGARGCGTGRATLCMHGSGAGSMHIPGQGPSGKRSSGTWIFACGVPGCTPGAASSSKACFGSGRTPKIPDGRAGVALTPR